MTGERHQPLRYPPESPKRPNAVYCALLIALILLYAVYASAEEVLVFRDSEDVVLDGAENGVDSYAPSVATNASDLAGLVWSDTQAGVVDTLMVLYGPTLESQSDVVYVNDLFDDTTTRNPRISAGDDQAFSIVWSDNRSQADLYDVYFARINTNMEKLFDEDVRVNEPFNDTNVETPDAASIGDGIVCICWTDNRQTVRDVYARRFHEDGKAIDARDFIVNPLFEGTNSVQPRVSGDREGTAVIVWSDDRLYIPGPPEDARSDIFFRLLPRTAIPNDKGEWPGLDEDIQVSDADDGTDDAITPAVAGNEHGLYVVAWCNQSSDSRDKHIYAAVITSSGERLTSEFQVDLAPSPGTASDPAVTFLGYDLFLISWYDGREDGVVVGRIYDAVIDRFISIEFVIGDLVGPTVEPSVAVFSDRMFMTAWANQEGEDWDVLGNIHFWDILGDLNVDTQVSALDLFRFAGNWQPKTEVTTAADFDVDGFVDANDVRIFRRQFGTNLAGREPLNFSVASASKRSEGRKLSATGAEPREIEPQARRSDERLKPRRKPIFIEQPGLEIQAQDKDFRLDKPRRVRSPEPSTQVNRIDTINDNGDQTPAGGPLFFRGKWR